MTTQHRRAPLANVNAALCMVVLAVVLGGVVVFAVGVGSVTVSVQQTWHVVLAHLLGTGPVDPVNDQILWQFRVPRVLLAVLCGAGLSVAGVVLQALVANPLADPYVLGVSSGASLGAALVLTLGAGAVGGLGVSSAAFLGAMLAVALVFALGQSRGRLMPTRLVLCGVAVGYVFTSVTSYVQLRATPHCAR